jgi:hypothetical protein
VLAGWVSVEILAVVANYSARDIANVAAQRIVTIERRRKSDGALTFPPEQSDPDDHRTSDCIIVAEVCAVAGSPYLVPIPSTSTNTQ